MEFPKDFERRGRNAAAALAPVFPHGRAPFQIARLFLATAIFLALMLCLEPRFALSQGTQLVKVDVTVIAKGYRASKLIGSSVTNDKSENVGKIDDIIIDHKNVLFAVLQVGGFLGVGAHLVAVPYESLVLDETGKKVELPGATKDQLKGLSEFKYTS